MAIITHNGVAIDDTTGALVVSSPMRTGKTFSVVGAVAAVTLPGIFVPIRSGRACTLVGVRGKVGGGTSVVAQMTRNGSNLGSTITVTASAATTAFSQALADGDEIGVVLSSPVGSPTNLGLTVILEYT